MYFFNKLIIDTIQKIDRYPPRRLFARQAPLWDLPGALNDELEPLTSGENLDGGAAGDAAHGYVVHLQNLVTDLETGLFLTKLKHDFLISLSLNPFIFGRFQRKP